MQMPIFTAAGAECTVLDYSEKQLELERFVAERESRLHELHIPSFIATRAVK